MHRIVNAIQPGLIGTHLGFLELQKYQNYLRCELGHNLPLTVHFNSFLICYEAIKLKRNVSSRMSLLP